MFNKGPQYECKSIRKCIWNDLQVKTGFKYAGLGGMGYQKG